MDFCILNHPCIPGIKPTWSEWMIVFMCSWIQLARILLSIFVSIFTKGNWSEVLYLCWVFLWFRYQSNCGFIECVGQSTFCFYSVQQFVKNWNYIFFEGLIELCTKPIWSWEFFLLLLFGRLLMTASIFQGSWDYLDH